MSFISSPLEQFSIISLIPFHFGNLYFSITNSTFILFIIFSIFCFLASLAFSHGGFIIPTTIQLFFESLYQFVSNLVFEQIGQQGIKRFFPLVFVIFTFLLLCNLFGMIPYSFTVTSHFIVTLGLAFSLFIGITIIGFQFHGIHFLSLLLPKGAPLFLAPFLVLLEFISYFFRAISLGVRLGANMMAGHTLVKILAGFSWTLVGGTLTILAFFPFFIVFLLTGLEIGIAIVQAYVFSMLICIYLNDSLYLH